MTQVEFDTAVVTLERNGRASIRTEYEERVFVSAYQMMRLRLNIPDNEDWEGPSDRELAEFLRGINRRERRLLKQIAERLD
jgi:hypothetical protein